MSNHQEPFDSFSIDTEEPGLLERATSFMKTRQEDEASKISVHDNFVYAYVVSCDERRIVLHTEYLDTGSSEYTDVVFSGVIAHHFEDCREKNILFDIEEDWPLTALREWKNLFEAGKADGWPVEYNTEDELLSKLAAMRMKSYFVRSVWGLFGWVWATDVEFIRRETRRQVG